MAEITQLPVIINKLICPRAVDDAACCPPYVERCQLGADTRKLYNECVTVLLSSSADSKVGATESVLKSIAAHQRWCCLVAAALGPAALVHFVGGQANIFTSSMHWREA